MIYHWKEPRIWGIAACEKNDKGQNVYKGETVTILPGVHDMPDEQWNKIKDHDTVKDRIAGNLLEVKMEQLPGGKKVKVSEDTKLPVNLDSYETRKAVDLVSGVMEVEQLKKWKRMDKRKVVKDAVDAQLKAIEFATKPKKQED